MKLDMGTLALVSSIATALQVAALLAQRRGGRGFGELGWWASGTLAWALALLVGALGGAGLPRPTTAAVASLLSVAGLLAVEMGVESFFGKRPRRWAAAAFGAAYALVGAYFVYAAGLPIVHRTLSSAVSAGLCLLIASHFRNRMDRRFAAAYGSLFLLFAANGVFFLARGLFPLLAAPASVFSLSSSWLAVTYWDALIFGILWSIGFVVLVGLRSHSESVELAARFRAIIEQSTEGIVLVDERGLVMEWNGANEAITGLPRSEAVGRPVWEVQFGLMTETSRAKTSVESMRAVVLDMPAAGRTRSQSSNVHPIRTVPGRLKYVTEHAFLIRTDTGFRMGIFFHDSTEHRRLEERLRQQAITDELTGAYNRRHFVQLAHAELRRAQRSGHPASVALVDLDRFKHVNDRYGHAAGDRVLSSFTRICREEIRQEIDVFARFGGDEFVILFPETDPERARSIMERIRATLSERPFDFDGTSFALTMSVGIASSGPESGSESVDAILARADKALYGAKEGGRNRVEVV